MKTHLRQLLDKSIAWHVRPHREALLSSLYHLSPALSFSGCKVLEIGASPRSSLSPFLVTLGAEATATCYLENELPLLKNEIKNLSNQYSINTNNIHITQGDIYSLQHYLDYDLVVIKDTFGGVNRAHNLTEFKRALKSCLATLKPSGKVLILDKAFALSPINFILSRVGEAGRNNWHYFSKAELSLLTKDIATINHYAAHGVMSFADFGGGVLQSTADYIDSHVLEYVFSEDQRAVYSCVIENLKTPGSATTGSSIS